MSKELLEALINLFALASNDDDITSESRHVVERFLQSELNQRQTEHYLKLYEDYFISYYKEGSQSKEDVLTDERVAEICQSINENLVQKQKVIVLLRLLEYIFADGNISEHELDFVKRLCIAFNIPKEERQQSLAFAESTAANQQITHEMLVVSDHEQHDTHRTYHMKHLDGFILILYLKSVNMVAFRYFGGADIQLNGSHIIPERTYILNQGASIRGTKLTPLYYSDVISTFQESSNQEQILFEAKDVTYEFKGGKIGLHPISISESGGKLIGVMGGSGSGKSTLLNVLNGNYVPKSGSVSINGINVHQEHQEMEGIIGFVLQDDLLMEDLTVQENLYYNAKLCFADLNHDTINKKVEDLLCILGLGESAHLKVGNPLAKTISGGQRKRLNIALELIREPSVLFLDEPTSGLSSRDSENIMDLLKQLTLKGKLIFVVIHQPSSDIFKMFDRLCLLDTGGYPVFYGDPVDSVMYFRTLANQVNSTESECGSCGNVNPEQLFSIIEQRIVDEYGNPTDKRKVSPKEWNKEYVTRIEKPTSTNKKLKPITQAIAKPSWLGQFKVFVTRDVKSKLSNTQYLLINLLEAPVLAMLLSYFVKFSSFGKEEYALQYNENLPAYIFMAVIVALFMGLTVSAEEIIRDQRIRKRERFLNLSNSSYLWSKICILFTISAIQTATFVLIGNSIMEIPNMNMSYWLVLFSIACAANVLGLNISASFNSAVTIYILIPFLIIPQLIFSGVIVKFDKLNPTVSSRAHVPAIGEIMMTRWAFEALAVAQFKDNSLEKEFYKYDKQLSILNYRKTYWLPEIQSMSSELKQLLKSNSNPKRATHLAGLLKSELAHPDERLSYPSFNFEVDLSTENQSMNESAFIQLDQYIVKLKKYLQKNHFNVQDAKDEKIVSIQEQPQFSNSFEALEQQHTNNSLKDLVTKRNELTKVVEINDRLIQRSDPIFQDATDFRAHFYAPRKVVFGKYIDTYLFNVITLWMMTVVLIIILHVNGLKRFLKLFVSRYS